MKAYLHLVSVLFVFVEGLVVVVVHHLHRLLGVGRHLVAREAEVRNIVEVLVPHAGLENTIKFNSENNHLHARNSDKRCQSRIGIHHLRLDLVLS